MTNAVDAGSSDTRVGIWPQPTSASMVLVSTGAMAGAEKQW
jgi:hypothetical protein